MKKKIFFALRRFYIVSVLSGINPLLIYKAIIGFPYFIRDFFVILTKWKDFKEFNFVLFPILTDRFETNGNIKNQYFIQDLYIAQLIFKHSPKKLVDWGSRVDGYVAHIASYRTIEVFDIRKQTEIIKNIDFKVGNLMDISHENHNYTDAISSLHVFDNIGLGRYSDPVNPMGHLIAFENIYKMLQSNGTFYFSTPIGLPQRIEFNANIVYSLAYLLEIFKNKYTLEIFSYIDDEMVLHTDIKPTQEQIESTFDCYFGLGIFVLKKK